MAVDKPSGVAVHPQEAFLGKSGQPSEIDLLRCVRDQVGAYVHPVHRLDRGTSGIVLFALDSVAARHLCQQFYAGTVEKTYIAWVRGWAPDQGEVTVPVKPGPRAGAERVAARTRFRTLFRFEFAKAVGPYASARSSLVECAPKTGRYHQIRSHLRSLNHPILGDRQHGDREHNRFAAELVGEDRLWLRCTEIEFFHPVHGRPVRIDAGWADPWGCFTSSPFKIQS